MNKIYFLIITAALLANTSHGQSKADLIRSIEELKVNAIQNQTKIESLQKDVDNLKVRVISRESVIRSQEKEILRLNRLLSGNETDIVVDIEDEISEVYSNEAIPVAQIKANFPGGEAAFRAYVAEMFVYPQRCLDEGINGYVMLRFIVDEAGRISSVQAIEESKSCPEYTKEAIRVLKNSPRWVPGQNNGKFVKSWREIPIQLNISK
jgi:TonB family protein